MQQLRHEACGKDIGQHSWATADELEEDITRLKLTTASRLLDLGVDRWSAHFRRRASALPWIRSRLQCSSHRLRPRPCRRHERREIAHSSAGRLERSSSIANSAFDAVLSVDVILHLRNRESVFQEVARVLAPAEGFCLPTPEFSPAQLPTRKFVTGPSTDTPNSFPPPE